MSTEFVPSISAETLRAANISPATMLATDFLNHYNEVAMLIDLLSMDPEVAEDILHWHPMSYIDHFMHSGFRDRELAVQAYKLADKDLTSAFEARCAELDQKIIHIQGLLKVGDVEAAAPLGKPLYDDIAAINALIVGKGDDMTPDDPEHDDSGVSQSDIDSLFA